LPLFLRRHALRLAARKVVGHPRFLGLAETVPTVLGLAPARAVGSLQEARN